MRTEEILTRALLGLEKIHNVPIPVCRAPLQKQKVGYFK